MKYYEPKQLSKAFMIFFAVAGLVALAFSVKLGTVFLAVAGFWLWSHQKDKKEEETARRRYNIDR